MNAARIFRSLIGALALAASGSALAADPSSANLGDTQKRMLAASDGHAIQSVLRLLEPGEALRLILVARQRASAESCDGVDVDQDKFRAVMQSIMSPLSGLVKEGQNNLTTDIVMAAYSVALGGHLAVAAYDKDAYCATVPGLRAALKDDPRVAILK